jgi:hypothetical protein
MEKIHGKIVIARFYPKSHGGINYYTGKMNGAPIFLFQDLNTGVIAACLQNEISEAVFDNKNFVMAKPKDSTLEDCEKGSDGECDGKCVDGADCPKDLAIEATAAKDPNIGSEGAEVWWDLPEGVRQ